MLKYLRHLLIPHESNNHRAKILHHDSLMIMIAFMLFLSSFFSFAGKAYPSVLGISVNISVQDLFSLTNQQRKEHGLAPLLLNDQLNQAAFAKAQDMFAKNYWAHVAPDGTTPWVFIKNSGYDYLYAGENLARGFNSASDVVNAWMASPSHRENVLSSNYNDVGFAISSGTLTGTETSLVVEEFGSKYLANAQPTPAQTAVAPLQPTTQPTIAASPTPAASPTTAPSPHPTSAVGVAAINNQPLIDSKSFTRNAAFFFLILFIAVLITDAIIIERKKIARVVAHNLDHILFLMLIFFAALIIGKGVVI